jgi:hypothetical protein
MGSEPTDDDGVFCQEVLPGFWTVEVRFGGVTYPLLGLYSEPVAKQVGERFLRQKREELR